jgi:lysozyme
MRIFTLILFMVSPMWNSQPAGGVQLPVMGLKGVDVSHHQKKIEWDTVLARQPLQFAFVKATEGSDFTDSLFCQNWQDLERLGVRRGAYHYFRASGCGYEQAQYFLQSVDMLPGDLAPVLDLESTDQMPPAVMVEEARAWLQTVEQQLGIKPIIYSNQHFYEHYLAGVFDNYPLWIARYSDEQPNLCNGRQWDFWQYSNKGCVDGICQHVDLNIFPGTTAMFDRLCWFPETSGRQHAVTF